MEIYAIANQKGGVGKTTVTLALAAELARRDVRTLVVDHSPSRSLPSLCQSSEAALAISRWTRCKSPQPQSAASQSAVRDWWSLGGGL